MLWTPEISPQRFTLLLFFFFRFKIGLRRPAVRRRSSSTPPRTKLLLRPPGCSDVARDQATLAGVAASSGGGATHCRSSSSWCPIRLHASCRSRADTAADVAEGRPPCAFQLPGLPSPSAAHCSAAVLGQKLLILCTRTCALLHGFDHVHLDLGYFGTKGISSA